MNMSHFLSRKSISSQEINDTQNRKENKRKLAKLLHEKNKKSVNIYHISERRINYLIEF